MAQDNKQDRLEYDQDLSNAAAAGDQEGIIWLLQQGADIKRIRISCPMRLTQNCKILRDTLLS